MEIDTVTVEHPDFLELRGVVSNPVTIDILNARTGHTRVFFENSDNIALRDKIAEKVEDLLASKFVVFLNFSDGTTARVYGYNRFDHEWILSKKKAAEYKAVSAYNTNLAAIAPIQGG